MAQIFDGRYISSSTNTGIRHVHHETTGLTSQNQTSYLWGWYAWGTIFSARLPMNFVGCATASICRLRQSVCESANQNAHTEGLDHRNPPKGMYIQVLSIESSCIITWGTILYRCILHFGSKASIEELERYTRSNHLDDQYKDVVRQICDKIKEVGVTGQTPYQVQHLNGCKISR